MGLWDSIKKDKPSDFDILVSKMTVWKSKHLILDDPQTSARQESILDLILTHPEYDLYKMIAHGTTCAFCAAREGRVYSRSGKDPVFPPLASAFQKIDKSAPDVLWNTYLIPHPGCTHTFIAWTPVGRSDACGIDKFPKTFQTFQKHKKENSTKYQEWMQQYGIIVQESRRR